eukprot:EG_transcript_2375
MARVLAMEAALRNGSTDPFCGRILTNQGQYVGAAGVCLGLDDLRDLDWEPWNVVDRGHYPLASEVCSPGEQSHWNEATGIYTCTACPAGTYSVLIANLTYQALVCRPCPAATYAARNATACAPCPAGTAVTAAQDGCAAVPLATAVLVGSVVGAVLGFFCLTGFGIGTWYAWKATADLRKLRKQFSNNNVAQECAEAIACFNLESVAWLRDCKNPNKIQESFLQILEMMTMVRPYIPDHVLSIFTQRQRKGEDEGQSASAATSPAVLPGRNGVAAEGGCGSPNAASVVMPVRSPLAGDHQLGPDGRPPQYIHVRERTSGESMQSSQRGGRDRRNPRGGPRHLGAESRPGEWMSRRCVYMAVCVSFASGVVEDDQVPQQVGHMLGEVISIGKNFGGTIDHVTYDKVALHWGLVTAVSEGALKATLAALEMAKVRTRLQGQWGALLKLSVSVVQGFYNVATISAANYCFFVVGGPLLRHTHELVAKDLAAKCKCEILVSASVQQQVQYVIDCMPRCFVGETLYWQPLKALEPGAKPEEWMYELRTLEAGREKWCSHSLASAFHLAAQSPDPAALQLVVDSLRAQHRPQMSAQDEACLDLLLVRCGSLNRR